MRPLVVIGLAFGLACGLSACGLVKPKPVVEEAPSMGWDHRPEAPEWTGRTLAAVAEKDTVLAAEVPADAAKWCPAYETASLEERRAFWAGLISSVAKYESTWNPQAVGGGGTYYGLMQILPKSAKWHGCEAQTPEALKDGAANLECAVTILSNAVEKDALVAGEGNRGIGRDWGPLRSDAKREAMREWVSTQSYCQA